MLHPYLPPTRASQLTIRLPGGRPRAALLGTLICMYACPVIALNIEHHYCATALVVSPEKIQITYRIARCLAFTRASHPPTVGGLIVMGLGTVCSNMEFVAGRQTTPELVLRKKRTEARYSVPCRLCPASSSSSRFRRYKLTVSGVAPDRLLLVGLLDLLAAFLYHSATAFTICTY